MTNIHGNYIGRILGNIIDSFISQLFKDIILDNSYLLKSILHMESDQCENPYFVLIDCED